MFGGDEGFGARVTFSDAIGWYLFYSFYNAMSLLDDRYERNERDKLAGLRNLRSGGRRRSVVCRIVCSPLPFGLVLLISVAIVRAFQA
jgi:hypothetical protein